ncbi:DUF397 domain-containing protein [Solihabitans fulvus]|uniref:DUF397 domain-containing protein n=1 Tax=Solihabitans fulvus TaxID=1892852 RepID=A0A5B2X6N9_9PSEU|nr:DUF397 domain-containing protein [Solihabitans fulvus]KAA2258759.1 DUF397 domain-containing protein [Solihabitans fulvus]
MSRPELVWRKSSRSGTNTAECVEVAFPPEAVAVRDSKNPDGPRLTFPRTAFAAFLERF